MYRAPSDYTGDGVARAKADHVRMFTQSLLDEILLHIPSCGEKEIQCCLSFYYRFAHWETILHGMTAMMPGSLGVSLMAALNNSEKAPMHLSLSLLPCLVVAFWEIYEFTFDGLLGLNMQKFMLEDGTQLVGRAALTDTMGDIIMDFVGALIISLFDYYMMKKYPDIWLNGRQVTLESMRQEMTEEEEKKYKEELEALKKQKVEMKKIKELEEAGHKEE